VNFGTAQGLSMTYPAMAFAIAHPGVTSAIIGPRTMEHLDDLLADAKITLDEEILDRIDEIVPPGTDIGPSTCPTHRRPSSARALRRRPVDECARRPQRPGLRLPVLCIGGPARLLRLSLQAAVII
jgi:Aldo/keto reductase family